MTRGIKQYTVVAISTIAGRDSCSWEYLAFALPQ